MLDSDFGRVKLHIDEMLTKKGFSKNKFAQKAEMQRTQLNKYCNGDIVLLDINVLGRMCTVLDCEISDILEFIPPGTGDEEG